MKFRKKPVIIDAVQWFKFKDHPNVVPIPEAILDTIEKRTLAIGIRNCGWIGTLEGGHVVSPGDWIITGVAGEQYPCKPEIFEATYEAVNGN